MTNESFDIDGYLYETRKASNASVYNDTVMTIDALGMIKYQLMYDELS